MQPRSIHARIAAHMKKRQLLMWLALATFLLGAIDIAFPLDFTLQTLRNKVRTQPVSGQVVVVGIDRQAEQAIGRWPWNNAAVASLVDTAFDRGATRVFLDVSLSSTDKVGDRRLVKTLNAHKGKVFIAAGIDGVGRAESDALAPPPRDLAAAASVVSETKWTEFWNGVLSLDYARRVGGVRVPSMEAAIAGVTGEIGERFPVDYSLQASSVPIVSAAELQRGEAEATGILKGRTVVIGLNQAARAERVYIPGQDMWAARATIVTLGAETLRGGRPVVIGWMPAWLLALVASAILLYAPKRAWARTTGSLALATLLFAPLGLEYIGVFANVATGILLLGTAMGISAWQRFGARKRRQGAINPISGLPTPAAILHGDRSDPGVLVAVRVRHFTDLVSALPPHYEQELIRQIVTRLSLGTGGAQLLHGDDGNFFWIAPSLEPAAAIDQFKALQLIFRQPIRVSDKAFDVDVAFGLDKEFAMPLSHRLASALAAAHAATQQSIGWKVHDPASAGAREWTLSLMGELDDAIQSGHVWVAYQPKMDLATREVIGCEALVRWTHATRGPINPAEFVELAERHGRISKITAFVLDEAIKMVRVARAIVPDFAVSVNISPSELVDRRLVDTVASVLERNRVSADALILEVTETAAIAEGETAQNLLNELREMGVGLSIDDYGTGMSTLEYMRRIPANEVKIDRRFVTAFASNTADQAVVRSTIELAHALGLKVVVEGIETAETLYMLAAMGCDTGQGYHIGRPMDEAALLSTIEPEARAVLNA